MSSIQTTPSSGPALEPATIEAAQAGNPQVAQADPVHQTDTGVYVTVHGHFYQPPRENPYLEAIEQQPSAGPFHDWNERIYHECYRPNAFARILNDRGEVVGIVNNYEYLSFNMGPTLLSWLERYDLEVYQRILEADRKSTQRLNGHGNAIAQIYNHIILPLANQRDKYTQVRWGKADFRARFGRDPEGMWLAEAAVDYPTLAVLVEEGVKFIILAPSQAQRCRPLAQADHPPTEKEIPWQEVGGNQIDPTRPYRCFIPGGDRQRDYIDIFFYDGPISRDMGFSELLNSSQHLAARLGLAVKGDHRSSQLIAVATDGETFGHHKGGAEKALAYAFSHEFTQRGWRITNFAHYLSLFPPTWEVELKPVTAWSCAHGVDRWQDNCGCGGEGSLWHQRWRRPLRDALDWLRDRLIKVFEKEGKKFFLDPWQVRDDYIEVLLNRGLTTFEGNEGIERFLTRHQTHPLTEAEQIDALRLLEMQRHALLMYTSCGWFFEELSRPEGVQILRYAARALELAAEVAGVQLEAEFVRRLSQAPSNIEDFGNGAIVYEKLVKPAQISLPQVAAHYAISSLLTPYPQYYRLFCYRVHQLDYHLQRIGSLSLAIGQLQLTSEVTQEADHFIFAVLHLGGWDFHCCVQPFRGRQQYSQLKTQLLETLKEGSAAHMILAMAKDWGEESYSLKDLFAEERQRMMTLLTQETLIRLEQLYAQVYRDNYGIMLGFRRDGLPVPQELQMAAIVALNHRAMAALRGLDREMSEPTPPAVQLNSSYVAELEAIAAEANHLGCQLQLVEGKQILERLIWSLLWPLLQTGQAKLEQKAKLAKLEQLLALGESLQLSLNLSRAQELFWPFLQEQGVPLELSNSSANHKSRQASSSDQDLQPLLHLGHKLGVDVSLWLSEAVHQL